MILGSVHTVLLTGGIGSGKSVVSSYLKSRGVPVYDSDSRTKSLYDTDPSIVSGLESILGVNLRSAEGFLDRKALAGVIFSDKEALSKVESIVHPAVLRDFTGWAEESVKAGWKGYMGDVPFVVMESAIALEKPLFRDIFDAVVLVTAPEVMRLERACRRDSASPEAVLSRMRNQHFDVMKADALINNDLGEEELRYRTDLAMGIVRRSFGD